MLFRSGSGLVLAIASATASDLLLGNTATAAPAITLNNANQTLEIGATGALTVSAAQAMSAGTIQLDGGSFTDALGLSMTGGTVTGFGTVTGAITGAAGTLTATGGTLTIASTVATGRTFVIGSSSASVLKLAAADVTGVAIVLNNANQTLEIGAAGALTISVAESMSAGTIQMDGGSLTDALGLAITGGSVTGFGTINPAITGSGGSITATGGTLNLVGAVATGQSFTIASVSGSDLKFSATAASAAAIALNNANQTLEVGAAGALTIGVAESMSAGTLKLGGGTFTDTGGLALTGGSVTGSGTLAAAITGSGATITAGPGTLNLTGTVDTGQSFAITSAAASDLEFSSTATAAAIAITVANQTLEIGSAGNLTIGAAQNVTQGTIKIDGGTLTDTSGITLGTLATNGAITGSGTIAANLARSGTGLADTITASGGTLVLTGTVSSGLSLAIASATASDLLLAATATAANAIAMNNANQTLEIGASGTLTIGAVESITNGTIKLDGGTLIDASGVTIGAGATLTGTGLAGAITATTGVITQTGGTLTLTSITGSGTVNGAPAVTGAITASGGVLDLKGTPTFASLAVAIVAGSDLKIEGTLSSGAITLNNANQTLEIGTTAALTLSAAETMTLGAIKLDGGTLTDAAGLTVTSGSVTGSGTIAANTTISGGAAGTLKASSGTLDIKGTVNSGPTLAIDVTAGSNLLLEGKATAAAAIAINNANQTLEIGSAGTLTIGVAESITNGTIKLDGGTLNDASGVTIGAGGTLTGTGTVGAITVTGGIVTQTTGVLTLASLTGSGSVNGTPSVTGAITASGGILDLTGTPTFGSLAIATAAGSDLKIEGTLSSGAITLNNANQTLELGATAALTVTAAEAITLGSIKLDGGSLIDASGVTIGAGATLIGSGTAGAITLSGGTVTQSGGTFALTSITGRGTVNGTPTATGAITASGGTLDITNSIGASAGAAFGIAGTAGSVMRLDGTVGAGNGFTFAGAAGALELNSTALANFNGTISGLTTETGGSATVSGSNFINVQGVTITSIIVGGTAANKFNGIDNTVTLYNNATQLGTLTLGSAPVAGTYIDFASDATTGGGHRRGHRYFPRQCRLLCGRHAYPDARGRNSGGIPPTRGCGYDAGG